MKKLIVILVALALICASAFAEISSPFYDLVIASGFEPYEVVPDDMFSEETVAELTAHGNMIVLGDGETFQMLLWYEGDKPYGVAVMNFDGSVDTQPLRDLFIKAITEYSWDVSSYSNSDDESNPISLNYAPVAESTDGQEYFESYDEYVSAVLAVIE